MYCFLKNYHFCAERLALPDKQEGKEFWFIPTVQYLAEKLLALQDLGRITPRRFHRLRPDHNQCDQQYRQQTNE
jgi:hypothetical protein